MYYQKVRYELYSNQLGLLKLVHDPIGWDEDEKTLERSANSESFFTRFSRNVIFIREGSEYILKLVNTFGYEVNLICRRFEVNPQTDEFEKVYEEYLDVSNLEVEEGRVSISFLSGGLSELIKAQFDEKFELQRRTDINGNAIPELQYKILGINQGRKILLESFAENLEAYTYQANRAYFSLTTNINYANDPNFQGQSNFDPNVTLNSSGWLAFNEDQIFYKNATKNIQVDVTFKVKANYTFANAGRRFLYINVIKALYSESDLKYNADRANAILIQEYDNQPFEISVDFEKTITLNIEEGYSYAFYAVTSTSINTGIFTWDANAKNISIEIKEDSTYPPTKAKGLLVKDVLERLLLIITGRNDVLKTDFFTSTTWAKLFVTSGILLREFPETQLDDNGNVINDEQGIPKTNGITTSLEDVLSIKTKLAIGWNVETINDRQYFRVEPLTHFFNYKRTIVLSGKYCPKETVASEFIFGNISIGNNKAGNYEEQQGLFEYNAVTNWTTPNVSSNQKLELDTKLRFDLIGMEFARRKAYSLYPTEDTPYDKEVFVIHSEPKIINSTLFGQGISNDTYRIRYWQDDFSQAPTDVYDPDTAGNLLLTPLRSLERHGWYAKSALTTNQNDFIRFANSTGNANMSTLLTGEVARKENGDYHAADLQRARFINRYLDFDFPNTFEVKQQINGFFDDGNGNKIPNYYGLVEFYNEEAEEKQYGWILKVVEQDRGSIRLIKLNR